MSHERPTIATQPEFSRPVELARLPKNTPYVFDETASASERSALAGLFDAQSVQKFRFTGRLEPLGKEGWRLKAELGASVTQSCVITLEPVKSRIDVPVARTFLSGIDEETAELDDDTEKLVPVIDLGLIATEAAAIALPDYPKAPGAELVQTDFTAPGVEPISDEDVKPFAGLKALRDKLSD